MEMLYKAARLQSSKSTGYNIQKFAKYSQHISQIERIFIVASKHAGTRQYERVVQEFLIFSGFVVTDNPLTTQLCQKISDLKFTLMQMPAVSWNSLPIELWSFGIVPHLFKFTDMQSSIECALVNKLLLQLVMPFVWRHVNLGYPRQIELFCDVMLYNDCELMEPYKSMITEVSVNQIAVVNASVSRAETPISTDFSYDLDYDPTSKLKTELRIPATLVLQAISRRCLRLKRLAIYDGQVDSQMLQIICDSVFSSNSSLESLYIYEFCDNYVPFDTFQMFMQSMPGLQELELPATFWLQSQESISTWRLTKLVSLTVSVSDTSTSSIDFVGSLAKACPNLLSLTVKASASILIFKVLMAIHLPEFEEVKSPNYQYEGFARFVKRRSKELQFI